MNRAVIFANLFFSGTEEKRGFFFRENRVALVLQTSAMSEKNLYERGSRGTRSGKGDRYSFLKKFLP